MIRYKGNGVLDPQTAEDIAGEAIRRARHYPGVDLLRVARLLKEEPHRFLRASKPKRVRCCGRRADGQLCMQWFQSPDILTRRRCDACHDAEAGRRSDAESIQQALDAFQAMADALSASATGKARARAVTIH